MAWRDRHAAKTTELRGRVEARIEAFHALTETDIPAFNEAVRALEAPAIVLKGD